ncbi:non-ribosomal peptide synthetase/type I polyketide synthase [Streptomyces sp. Caat 7-52]|uniref:non-ribosomal peptide synthetase/type I polyketide synthase n=1 Tax=Streptomyces sp. Caat 7-52 TaxID=2949637 RepID=UPI00203528D0|nr:non-ribosomal peptide synthetase/type I polyketide synthase [Streptomyces sp. Caat 7-52]
MRSAEQSPGSRQDPTAGISLPHDPASGKETLGSIWREVLRIERFDPQESFFELGGDSLLAAQIVVRIRERLGVEIPVRDIFVHPTLDELADAVATVAAAGEAAEAAAPAGPAGPHPQRAAAEDGTAQPVMSANQEQMWFLHKLTPNDPVYNGSRSIRVRGALDLDVLEWALTEVYRRHEALRTSYREENGTPVPVVHEPRPVRIGRADLSGLPEDERESARERRVSAELARPFSLADYPLERWLAIRLGPDEHELLVVAHHILHDGWSFAVELREVETLYNARAAGRDAGLPAPALQHGGYARQQREEQDGPAMRGHLAYWQEQLADYSGVLSMPTDRPRPPVQTTRGRRVYSEVPAGLLDGLGRLRRSDGVSPFMALFACFTAVLHRYSGDTDICVGTPLANRRSPAEEEMVGMVMNSAALRTRVSPELPFSRLLKQVRDTVLDAAAHQACPLPVVIDALGVPRTPAHPPLFQTMVTAHDHTEAAPRFGDCESSITEPFNDTVKMDLHLIVVPQDKKHASGERTADDGIALIWEYNADLFDTGTVESIAAAFQELLAHALQAPETPVGELRLLDEDRAGERLREWSAPQPVDPAAHELPVHRRVQRQGQAQPGKAAVVEAGRTMTYGELDEGAERLAARLKQSGAGRGTVIAVCLPIGADLVLAELAVLKSGATFLPLDPGQPQARMDGMLEDADALAVITSEELRDRFPGRRCLTVRDGRAEDGRTGEPVADEAGPDDIAYIIFTSGSTGRPKGVEVPHRGLGHLASWYVREYEVTPDDAATLLISPGFDVSQLEIWPALAAGATLHCPDRATVLVAADYQAWLRENSITLTVLPTAIAAPLLDREWDADTTLRMMLVAGERLTARPRPGTPFRFVNAYGPTEATVLSTAGTVRTREDEPGDPPIGRPLPGWTVRVLDRALRPVPPGVIGELYIGGVGVAQGYRNRPELTEERFLADPFAADPGARMYRTGDLARLRADGEIEFIGRMDEQVKLRGYRIELGEITAALRTHPQVGDAHVLVRAAGDTPSGDPADRQLVAYVVPAGPDTEPAAAELREHLSRAVPEYMVPAAFVTLTHLPLNPSGKVDAKRLPAPVRQPAAAVRQPAGELERQIAGIWQEVLGVEGVGSHQSFFDLGGHSLLLTRVQHRLDADLGIKAPLMTLFEFPTVHSLAAHLSGEAAEPLAAPVQRGSGTGGPEPIAVVGMSGRFPGAADVGAFWENLCDGVESITQLGPVEPDGEGLTAFGLLDSPAEFDAAFFGYSPREALLIDPQQRVFLEVAHSALENAGLVPEPDGPSVGIFAGGSMTTYYSTLQSQRGKLPFADDWQFRISTAPDYLTSRAAHKLGLNGPAVTVATACSTSLTAIHLAAQALASGDCDVALAGGAGVRVPLLPVRYTEGGPFAVDGQVRAFDADADGIVGGSAAAVVVLKRLSDAVAAGDHIHAVLRGSAVNNDAGEKIGFTAPSIDGQAKVIRAAHLAAGIEPDSIGYVEAHGTGTRLGDPIEVAALTKAFRAGTDRAGFCWLGSVKTNIGHTDAAAGVVGFIKAVLAVEKGVIPPSLHFERPNPEIDFETSPFRVNTELCEWQPSAGPRRAGVSALGIGGTNAHVVVEQPPAREPARPTDTPQLLPLSAASEAALDRLTENLAERLAGEPGLPLADVAFTLQRGRRAYPFRRFVVGQDTAEVARALTSGNTRRVPTSAGAPAERPVAFMFPGQGGQHVGMARDLYEHNAVFRRHVDEAFEAAHERLGLDLRSIVYPDPQDAEAVAEAGRRINTITVAQPAVFILEYALGRLWQHWGIQPSALVGHSLGAYAAACTAGVFSLADGISLVGLRGQLLSTVEAGAMLAVKRPEAEVLPLLPDSVTVGAVNGPGQVTVSGREADIDLLAAQLTEKEIDFRKLKISGAGHSPLVEPILDKFGAAVAAIELHEPTVPFVSDMTGTWAEPGQLTDPAYWMAHMRNAVRFGDAVSTLLAEPERILLEVGPGMTLTTLSRQHPELSDHQLVLQSQPHPTDPASALSVALEALGRLWLTGAPVGFGRVQDAAGRRRAKLPGHPLDRRHYLVEPADPGTAGGTAQATPDAWLGRTPGTASPAARPQTEAATALPGSATEERITETFRQLLGLDEVAPDDSLFDLGGDSVLVTRLAAWLRDTYGIPLEAREIFTTPTVSGLAGLTERRLKEIEH